MEIATFQSGEAGQVVATPVVLAQPIVTAIGQGDRSEVVDIDDAAPVIVIADSSTLPDVVSGDEALYAERMARIAGDAALQRQIDTINSAVESLDPTAEIGGAIGDALATARGEIAAARADLQGEIDANAATVRALFDSASAGDGELSAFVGAMRSHFDLQSAMRAAAAVAAGLVVATTQISDARSAIVETQQTGLAKVGEVAAAFADFETAQVADNAAKAGRLSALETHAGETDAAVESVSAALSDAIHAAASKSDTIVAGYGAGDAKGELAAFLAAARSGADAVAAARGTAQALAGVQRVESAIADQGRALASSSFSLGALIGQNYAAFVNQVAAQATINDATAAHFDSLTATVTGNYSLLSGQITSLSTVVSDLKAASASKVDFVGAAVGAKGDAAEVAAFVAAMRGGASLDQALRKAAVNAAGVQQQAAAVADLNRAISTLSATTFARFGDNLALIQAQATALADASKALAAKDDLTAAALGGGAGEVAAFITAMRAGGALDEASRGKAKALAAVAQQTLAQTDAAKAMASLSSTVAAQFGDAYAAINVQAGALATMQGQVAAAYSLTLDVNGFVTGYQLVNGGPGASSIVFRTDKFAIAAPGGSGLPIFEVGTRNGAAAIVLRAPLVADNSVDLLQIAAGALAPVAVEVASGAASVSVNLAAGASVAIIASFGGYVGGSDTYGTLALSIGGSVVKSQAIQGATASGGGSYSSAAGASSSYILFASTLAHTYTAGAAGSVTFSAVATGGVSNAQRGPITLIVMKLGRA